MKLYRNGKYKPDSMVKTVIVNLTIFPISILLARFMDLYIKVWYPSSDVTVYIMIFAVTVAVFMYSYLTMVRLRPLAKIESGVLKIFNSLFLSESVTLDDIKKIKFESYDEKDKRMLVYTSNGMCRTIMIPQSNCDLSDFKDFIDSNHSSEIVRA